MSVYRVIKPTMGEIHEAIMSALAKAGVNCGYEIEVKLLNAFVMQANDSTVSDGTRLIVPETVAEQRLNSTDA
jgi:hypothetical protein